MSLVVLDASAALAWLLESQATVASAAILARLDAFEFTAPFVFDWEVQNVLLTAGRLDTAFYAPALAQLDRFGVLLEPPVAVTAVLAFAQRNRLSLFDAAYLKLALDEGLPLMSRDKRLVETALSAGVTTYDLR